jgi:hypothetical protein
MQIPWNSEASWLGLEPSVFDFKILAKFKIQLWRIAPPTVRLALNHTHRQKGHVTVLQYRALRTIHFPTILGSH